MRSLSQPPGHPDPPLGVWLPKSAGRQSGPGECSTGRVSQARALGGLGKFRTLQTAGQGGILGLGQLNI